MRKSYRYRDLQFPVADETAVNFTVKFISDGNLGTTTVVAPGLDDGKIVNSGDKIIGTGKSLRGKTTISTSDISNLVPNVEEIRIQYFINDKLLVDHVNKKSEEERPMIYLYINFPAL